MKNYTITVNGNIYHVTVEEGTVSAPVRTAAPAPQAPKPAPVPAPKPVPAKAAGSVDVIASVPGKICKVEVVQGQAVKAGDTVIILEAMKMEMPIPAPADGIIAGICVSTGDAVETGDVLATMN